MAVELVQLNVEQLNVLDVQLNVFLSATLKAHGTHAHILHYHRTT